MKQLTPLDASFYYFESFNQPMIIGGVWLCDQSTAPNGIVRHKEILRYIEHRLETTPLFRRRLQRAPFQLDDPYWLEVDNFDLEYHVRHVGLPQPGDWRQLCVFTARTMSRSIDMERPPWEIYIIEGLNNIEGLPPNSFAVLLRFHHAYVDGKASFELNTALMEDTPDHQYQPPAPREAEVFPPTPLEMWLRTAPRLLTQGLRGTRAGLTFYAKSLELYGRLSKETALAEQLHAPRTIFNTEVTPHRVYGGCEWTLEELKQIRTLRPGASVNDVILAIIGGGMRRYLLEHDALPEDESLISMCPVALRPADTEREGGNRISAMYVALGTDIEDPIARLAAIQKRTAEGIPLAKEVLYDLGTAAGEMIPPYLRAMAGWLHAKTRIGSDIPTINTTVTNVPGIPGVQPKYFAGAKIRSVYPLVPIGDGAAISHGITGIYERINLGVMADRKVLPDIDFYISCMSQSMAEYQKLAAPRPAAPATTQKRRTAAAKRQANKETKAPASAEPVVETIAPPIGDSAVVETNAPTKRREPPSRKKKAVA